MVNARTATGKVAVDPCPLRWRSSGRASILWTRATRQAALPLVRELGGEKRLCSPHQDGSNKVPPTGEERHHKPPPSTAQSQTSPAAGPGRLQGREVQCLVATDIAARGIDNESYPTCLTTSCPRCRRPMSTASAAPPGWPAARPSPLRLCRAGSIGKHPRSDWQISSGCG